ncbi:MAG: geranylgeranyl reductase family protein [Pseudomonadota bacterium]
MKPDCIIVGAGPAGAAAALVLARAGARALVLAREGGRPKACGGGISPRALALARDLGLPVDPGRPLYCLEGNSPPWRCNRFHARKPFLSVVDRARLDRELAEAAAGAGAEIAAARVTGVRHDGRMFTVETDRGLFSAPMLIGADGAAGRVGRSLSARVRHRAVALMMDNADTARYADRIVFDGLPEGMGYGWVFPTHGATGNAGVYSLFPRPAARLRARMEAYLAWRLGKVPPGPVTGGSIPWGGYTFPHRLPVILAGDAGGFADPLTGEGIYHALYTGRAAGRAVLRAGGPDRLATAYARELGLFLKNVRILRFLAPRVYRFPRAGGRLLSLSLVNRPLTEGLARGMDTSRTLAFFPGLALAALADPLLTRSEHGACPDGFGR